MSSGSTRHKGSSPQAPSDGSGSAGISDDVALLSQLVHELEDQLRRLVRMNDALERDLEDERTRTASVARLVEKLEERFAATVEANPDSRDLLEERSRASAQRGELASQRRLLEQQLRGLLERHPGRQRQARSLREELARLEIELQSVESQLARALASAGSVGLQVNAVASERDRLRDAVQAAQEQVDAVRRERDSLGAEVAESRVALQELQRRLGDRF